MERPFSFLFCCRGSIYEGECYLGVNRACRAETHLHLLPVSFMENQQILKILESERAVADHLFSLFGSAPLVNLTVDMLGIL